MYLDDMCVDNASYKVQLDSINEVQFVVDAISFLVILCIKNTTLLLVFW